MINSEDLIHARTSIARKGVCVLPSVVSQGDILSLNRELETQTLDVVIGAPTPRILGLPCYFDASGVILEEPIENGQKWSKIERAVPTNKGFSDFALRIADLISNIQCKEYCLVKDKINYMYPGQPGFDCHQDFESYRHFSASYHITAMISLVPTHSNNGCMFFCGDYREEIQEEHIHRRYGGNALLKFQSMGSKRGNVDDAVVELLDSTEIHTSIGDIILFDSFVPHGSRNNATSEARPLLFLTYSPRADGLNYESYYKKKISRLLKSMERLA